MRTAEPVEVTLGSGLREAVALATVWSAAIGSALTWLAARGDWPLELRSIAGVALVVGGAVAWYAGRPMRGRLAWDGALWCWHGEADGGRAVATGLRIAIDGGGWVLLRDDAGHWCALTRHEAGALWHGLRLALQAGRPTGRAGAAS